MDLDLLIFKQDDNGGITYTLHESLKRYAQIGLTIEEIKRNLPEETKMLDTMSILIKDNLIKEIESTNIKDVLIIYCGSYKNQLYTGFKVNKKALSTESIDGLMQYVKCDTSVRALYAIESYIIKYISTTKLMKIEGFTILSISAIKTLRGDVMLQCDSELNKELYKTHFISKNFWRDNNYEYSISEYRPGIRNFLMDIIEYSEYILRFIENGKLLNRLKSPEIFKIDFSVGNERNIEFNNEFLDVLSKYLREDEINYFISELFCLVLELDEEIEYVLRNLNFIKVLKAGEDNV